MTQPQKAETPPASLRTQTHPWTVSVSQMPGEAPIPELAALDRAIRKDPPQDRPLGLEQPRPEDPPKRLAGMRGSALTKELLLEAIRKGMEDCWQYFDRSIEKPWPGRVIDRAVDPEDQHPLFRFERAAPLRGDFGWESDQAFRTRLLWRGRAINGAINEGLRRERLVPTFPRIAAHEDPSSEDPDDL